jgi:hypothetical protein
MADTIVIPGTKTKLPMWAVLAAGGAGLFVFLVGRGKSGGTTGEQEALDTAGLLSSELNQRLYEFLQLIQGSVGQPQGTLDPFARILPGTIIRGPPAPSQIIGPPLYGGPPAPLPLPPGTDPFEPVGKEPPVTN